MTFEIRVQDKKTEKRFHSTDPDIWIRTDGNQGDFIFSIKGEKDQILLFLNQEEKDNLLKQLSKV